MVCQKKYMKVHKLHVCIYAFIRPFLYSFIHSTQASQDFLQSLMSGGKAGGGGALAGSRAPSRLGTGAPIAPGAPSPTPMMGPPRPHGGDSMLSVGPSPPVPMFPPGKYCWKIRSRSAAVTADWEG